MRHQGAERQALPALRRSAANRAATDPLFLQWEARIIALQDRRDALLRRIALYYGKAA